MDLELDRIDELRQIRREQRSPIGGFRESCASLSGLETPFDIDRNSISLPVAWHFAGHPHDEVDRLTVSGVDRSIAES